jgi:toxin-antitoxin system PIN domain toxin
LIFSSLPIAKTLINTAKLNRGSNRRCGSRLEWRSRKLTLSGCLRVITHPKIFKKPSPLALAREFVEDFRSREAVHLLAPGAGHWKIFVDLCRRADARGNLVPDAFHAALAIELGCEWLTLDRGFARFPGLKAAPTGLRRWWFPLR